MEHIKIYHSSSTKCDITNREIETMEPYLKAFGERVNIKIIDAQSHEKIKNKVQTEEINEKEQNTIFIKSAQVSCDKCGNGENTYLLSKYENKQHINALCKKCITKFQSRLKNKIQKYKDSIIHYDSRGIAIYGFREKHSLYDRTKEKKLHSKRIIQIGREDTGKISRFKLNDIGKLEDMFQNPIQNKQMRMHNGKCYCNICQSQTRETDYYLLGQQENSWEDMKICQTCRKQLKQALSELTESKKIMAHVI